MGTIKARGQITIVDLNDGRSLNMYLSANQPLTQIYDSGATSSHYVPDYTTSNLIITPQVFVSGITTDQIEKCGGTVVWTINGSSNIADYGGSASSTAPYALTISKNMVNANQLRIECSAAYYDEDTTLSTTVKANLTLTRVNNAGNSCVAIMYAPYGTTISKTEGSAITSVVLHCDMWRGSNIDDTDVTYQWSKRNTDGTFTNLVNGTNYSGVTTNELTIQADGVDNFNVFKCSITDTDKTATTYGKVFEATMTVNDATDPYSVEITSTTGNVITKAADSTTLKANIWQNGELLGDSIHNAATFQWTKYDKDGLNPISIGTGTGSEGYRSRTITKEQVTVRTTIVCEVTIP